MNRIAICVVLVCLGLGAAASGQRGTASLPAVPDSQPRKTSAVQKAQFAENYGKLPLTFEANIGQADKSVKFLSRGRGYGLYLTGGEAVLALHKDRCAGLAPAGVQQMASSARSCGNQAAVVRMRLAGAGSGAAAPSGEEQLPGTANYFIGNDPARWRTSVPTYAKVRYRGVYPGVDLVYYGNQRQLEYDFVVAPGADPKPVRLQVAGAKGLWLRANGDLVVTAAGGTMTLHKPVAYQVVDGRRQTVASSFTLRADTVGFRLGSYDRGKTLVIDPALVYSTYLGGSFQDEGKAITVDAAGNAYVAGNAYSVDFPVTQGAFRKTSTAATYNQSNAFVTKLSADGSTPIYSTYLGGSANVYGVDDDFATAVVVDLAGNAYITGQVSSTDFPVTSGAFQTTNYGGNNNAFVTKLNPTGSALIYSTYLGGSGPVLDGASGLAVDSAGNAYVAGSTSATNFPVTPGAFQTKLNGSGANAFVTKLNPAGSALVYSTYVGGSRTDHALALAVDASGSAYITGTALSTDFPVTPGAFQTKHPANSGYTNPFVAKLNPAGSALVYSTYVGGTYTDEGYALAVDSGGNAYIAGESASTDFPVTQGAFQMANSAHGRAFVAKLNPAGNALVYGTFLGGSRGELPNGLVVDNSGNAYVAGLTYSTDYPVTAGAFQTTTSSPAGTGFVTKLNSAGSALVYSTYLGGSGNQGFNSGCPTPSDSANGLAVDGSGAVYITGYACSADFPVTPGAFQTKIRARGYYTNGGILALTHDAFVTKLDLSGSATTPAPAATITSLSPSSATAGGGAFTLTVNGANFISGATVNWGATALTTTVVSAVQLTAVVPANLIAAAGTVSVTVTSNGVASNAATFTIQPQTVSPCVYTVSPTAPSTVAATGGNVPISIQTGAACAWSVSVLPSWITVAASLSGAGPATVTLVVAANAGAARSANISVAGQTVTVAEAAAAPSGQSGGIATFAGNGTQGFSGDGPAASTELNFPTGLAVDASGNLFIADQSNARIRKVSAAGIVTTVAGSGTFGFSGDNGPAVSASLNGPQGIAVDASGNLYIADTGNSRVRMVSTSGTIITVAGNGTAAFSGDGGSAISASLCFPFGVAVDTTGNLYIADTNNLRIRKVSANGIITTVAGGGTNGPGDIGPATSASLFPKGVAVNAAGDLLIADTGNSLIRKVTSGGAIATVAGNWIASFSGDGGPATSASLCTPFAVAIDASGNIFIGDTCNNRIRKVSAGGIITTLAGNGAAGFSGDGGPAVSASMNSPRGVAVDSSGNVFFADAQNNRIREVLAQGASTPAITVSPSSLAFSLAAGGSSSQQINLASPSSVPWSASASASWITLTPTSGTSPGAITVGINTASLKPGPYTATITISNSLASPAQETVSVSLTVTPALSIAPASLSFQIQQGTAAQSQSIQIGGTAGTAWQATAAMSTGGAWLTVSPAAGQIPASLTALVNPGSLTAGTYVGSIAVQAPGATPASSTIVVTLTVTTVSGGATVQFVQQGGKLVGTGEVDTSYMYVAQGYSVALSGDGNTAIVGAPSDNDTRGAVWVYVRSGGVWTQQGSKLVVSGLGGNAGQGDSVALSADGNTALVGTLSSGALVYTRSGGVWTQQGGRLIPSQTAGNASQGGSVALSTDGNTAIVGASGLGAYVYTRSAGVWTQQNSIVGSGGDAVALSGDGNTALLGAANSGLLVYTRSGGVWTQQGGRLVGTGAVLNAQQGLSLALSNDGNTALVGGPGDNADVGAAWVFTRSGSVWVQQGGKLVGADTAGTAQQGLSVALSGDGNTALVGGPGDHGSAGAVWVYARNGGVWTQQGGRLVGTGAWLSQGAQGWSLGLSTDGNTALVGGPGDDYNNYVGAAWVYVATRTSLPAAVPSINPGGIVPVGSTVSTIQPGEWVSIYGANLASSTATWSGDFPQSLGGTGVTIDGRAAYLALVSPGQINLQVPNDTVTGSVPVVVTTSYGSATATVTLAQFAPSFFLLDAKHVAGIILRANGAYDIIGPTGNSLGYATVAAKPGDTIELFAGGLGPTNPAVPAGQVFSSAAATTNSVKLLMNNVTVTPDFAGLSGAGLYQINVTVPAGLGSGDVSLVATVGGAQTQTGVVISLQAAAPQIQSVTLSPDSVASRGTVTGSVVLSAAAPSSGAVVALSSDSAAASVPATVTVAAGASSATFTVSAGTVSTSQTVTITASYGGQSAQATLTVVAASTGGCQLISQGPYQFQAWNTLSSDILVYFGDAVLPSGQTGSVSFGAQMHANECDIIGLPQIATYSVDVSRYPNGTVVHNTLTFTNTTSGFVFNGRSAYTLRVTQGSCSAAADQGITYQGKSVYSLCLP